MKNQLRMTKRAGLKSAWLLSTLAIFISGFVAGCGIAPEGDDSEAAQRRRQNEKLEQSYSSVQGLYRGSLRIKAPTTSDNAERSEEYRTLDGALVLYIGTVQEGFDRAGAPIFHPRLFAQLKLNSIGELDDTTFLLDYNEVTGEVDFRQPPPTGGGGGGTPGRPVPSGNLATCPVGPKDAQLTMRGRILDGAIENGSVNGTSGPLGTITMKLVSGGAFQPFRDQRERQFAAFSKIRGVYAGTFVGDSRGNFPVRIDLNIVDTVVSEYLSCYSLKGNYSRPDLVSGAGAIVTNADFGLTDSRLILNSINSSSSGIPGHDYLSISSKWSSRGNGSFAGSMQWWDRMGNVKAVRCRDGETVSRKGECVRR